MSITIEKEAAGQVICTPDDAPVFLHDEKTDGASQHEVLMHWHDSIEIVRIRKGELTCQVGQTNVPMSTGDVCLVNARCMHRIQKSGDMACSYSVMMLNPAQFTRDEAVFERYIAPVINDESFDYLLMVDCAGTTGELCSMIDAIERLQAERPLAYELEVIAIVHLLFRQLYMRQVSRERNVVSRAASQDALAMRNMTSFIYAHYPDHVTLDDIAHAGSMSKSKCSTMFREITDTSPVEFLNRYRLEAAAQMLVSSDESIARISSDCGFTQQSYFNRVFLRAFGVTPKQYRATYARLA